MKRCSYTSAVAVQSQTVSGEDENWESVAQRVYEDVWPGGLSGSDDHRTGLTPRTAPGGHKTPRSAQHHPTPSHPAPYHPAPSHTIPPHTIPPHTSQHYSTPHHPTPSHPAPSPSCSVIRCLIMIWRFLSMLKGQFFLCGRSIGYWQKYWQTSYLELDLKYEILCSIQMFRELFSPI